MAENYNSVPRGTADTGAAVVFDQNIATNPTTIWRQQNRFNAAQKEAEARRLAQQEKDAADRRKALALDAQKTSSVYQESINQQYKKYMDDYTDALKTSKGKLSYEKELEFKRRGEEIKSNANYGLEVVKQVENNKNDLLKDKELNPDFIAEYTSNVFFNPDNTPKYANDFQLNNIATEVRKDPRAYNKATIGKNLEEGFNKETREKFSRSGAFDIKTVIENNLPYELDNNRQPVLNPKTGRPKLLVNENLMAYVDNYPNAKALIDAEQARDEAQGIYKPRADYVKDLLESNLRVTETTSRDRIPRYKDSDSEKSKKQPAKSSVGWSEFALSGQSDKTSADSNGNWLPSQTVIATPGLRFNTDKNDKPYVRTLTSGKVINLNEEGQAVSVDTGNRNPLKMELGATVIGITDANDKPITAPKGLSEQEFKQWFSNEVRKRSGRVNVGFYSTGVVSDKLNVDLDMSSTGESESESNAPTISFSSSQTPRIRQSQRRVMVPLTGLVKSQLPADLLPDDDLNAELRKLQGEINQAKFANPAKSKNTKNDVFGFSANANPAPTTTKAKNNPLGF